MGPTRAPAPVRYADGVGASNDSSRHESSPPKQEEKGQALLVAILLDLTYYDYPELTSCAVELLVREFEQRKVLANSALSVQLLFKPYSVQM